MLRRSLVVAALILSLGRSLFAAYIQKVPDGSPAGPINKNLENVNNELFNTVHKQSTETITGPKYFTNLVDFKTVYADTATFAYSVFMATSSGNVGIGTTSPAFDANSSKFFAVNNSAAAGFSEVGAGGNATGTADALGLFAFFNSSLGTTEKRNAVILGINDGATNSGAMLFYTAAAGTLGERVRITNAGNVGIGATSPTTILDVNGVVSYRDGGTKNRNNGIVTEAAGALISFGMNDGTSNRFGGSYTSADQGALIRIDTRAGQKVLTIGARAAAATTDVNSFLEMTSAGAFRMNAYGAGAATFDANGNITSVSDDRAKDIQGPFTKGLAAIHGINPVIYRYKITSTLDHVNNYVGFTTQNVELTLPEAVYKNPGRFDSFWERAVVAALVNSIKELEARVIALEAAP